ncbi:alpha/beta-hydrolase [Phlegmacium glaucopus]|nr:alpha/beta-hydrolase [Phlegmacium glaucopus]
MSSNPQPLPSLPSGITSRIITVNELNIHILEAKPDQQVPTTTKPPLLILLHGFPEFCYSWRKVMVPLAQHGYFVVAPDQRGFGQTALRHSPSEAGHANGKIRFDDDLAPYGSLNLAADIVSLVNILGYTSVAGIIGHDFGSRVAAYCALIRPDLFKSVVIMSSPFTGTPSLSETDPTVKPVIHLLNDQLAILDPPRKHYTMYFSSPDANVDMSDPDKLHTFLRTYFHVKSGDWKPNSAATDLAPSVSSMSTMPHYYIMPLSETMPSCLAPFAPTADEVAQNKWLTEDELAVYVAQYAQTGFQGGLNWYRCQTDPGHWAKDTRVFFGKQISIPAMFLSGAYDWGVYQFPGAVEAMRTKAFRNMEDEDFVLVQGAGHWVQQEKPEVVLQNLLRFLKKVT